MTVAGSFAEISALSAFTIWALGISFAMTGVALLLAFVRLVMGPTLADRVIASDLITTIVVVLLTLIGMALDNSAYIDAAIALGLIAFLATVAFARYIERLPRMPDSQGYDPVTDYTIDTTIANETGGGTP